MRVLGLILIVVLVLGAPPASAAGSREPEGLSFGGVLSAFWEALVELIPTSGTTEEGGGSGTDDDDDGGPHMDPNGKPTGP
jgi:hypothetical protein